MANENQEPQGAIPPKVTPFSQPGGPSPVTPVMPGSPRPITVRLRPATQPAPNVGASAVPAVGIPTPPSVNPRSTARVPVPEAVSAAPVSHATVPATVRLRPVSLSGTPSAPSGIRAAAPSSTQSIASVPLPIPPPTAASTQSIAQVSSAPAPDAPVMHPQHPPTPGSHPLPDGPKPPSGAQVQASKSKTSRISLESAIGVAPMSPMGADKSEPKTIRLKRPTDLAAPTGKGSTATIRQTSRIPDAVLATAAEAPSVDTSSVTQKKTLKIRRPGAREEGSAAEGAVAAGDAFSDGVQMTPVGSLDLPVAQESSVFTAVAVCAASIAAVLLLLLTLCLGAHAVGPNAGTNSLASIKLGSVEVPWGGRLN